MVYAGLVLGSRMTWRAPAQPDWINSLCAAAPLQSTARMSGHLAYSLPKSLYTTPRMLLSRLPSRSQTAAASHKAR